MKFQSTKILIVIIICNLAVLAGYYFLFKDIERQTKEAGSLTDTIDLGESKNSRLSSLRAVVKDTETKRQQISGYLLPTESQIQFIENIENLAKKSGLEVKTNNIANADSGVENVKYFKIQIQTQGSWNNVMYFLNQLENMPYDIRVSSFSNNKDAKSLWTANFDISVTETTNI